jgi:hypothetical protein
MDEQLPLNIYVADPSKSARVLREALLEPPKQVSKQKFFSPITECAKDLGFNELEAATLAKLAVNARTGKYVTFLLQDSRYARSVKDCLAATDNLAADPVGYAEQFRKVGNARVRGYETARIQMCSRVQVLQWIMGSARTLKAEADYSRMVDEVHWSQFSLDQAAVEIHIDQLTAGLLERAFRHDMRAIGVPVPLLDTLLHKLQWEKAHAEPMWSWSKPVIRDACYHFFPTRIGKQFVQAWQQSSHPDRVIAYFVNRFCNDVSFNPSLGEYSNHDSITDAVYRRHYTGFCRQGNAVDLNRFGTQRNTLDRVITNSYT